jgi:hypothetical protein
VEKNSIIINNRNMAKRKTSSPVSSKQGCLCEDGTYSKDCCKGDLINQGIGSTENQSTSTVTVVTTTRTITSVNG